MSANLHSVGEAVNRVQHESENLSGYTTRLSPISPYDTLQIFRFAASHLPPPRLAGFRFSGSQSPATLTKRQAHESLRTKRMAQQVPGSVTDAGSGVARGNGGVRGDATVRGRPNNGPSDTLEVTSA